LGGSRRLERSVIEPRDTAAAATAAEKRILRAILAMLPPVVAFFLQQALGPLFRPHVWFLFYPAVFLSSWIGGLRVGVVASAASAVLVLWKFPPPELSFDKSPGQYVSAPVF